MTLNDSALIRGKVSIVTGGTRGIGRSISEALLRAGAKVVICGRDQNDVNRAVNEMKGTVKGMKCDVRSLSDVKKLVKMTIEAFGGVDILINNAGVAHLGRVDELAPEAWKEVIDTNLTGAFYCAHEVIPEMKRRGGGQIINMASRSGMNAYAGGSAYNASKFGLIGFSEAMFLDLRSERIRVSYVMPGRVGTDFAGEEKKPWHLSPDDVAEAVLDILKLDSRAVMSRVELRPTEQPVS